MSWLRGLPIRLRLTCWYVGVLLVVLGIYIAVVLGFQFFQLREQVYRDEVREVETVEGLLYFDQGGQLHLHDEYYSHPESRLLVDRLFEVHDQKGTVLLRSGTLRGRELGPAAYPHEGAEWFERRTLRLSDGAPVIMVSHLHPVEGRMLLLRLGYDLHPIARRMFQFAGLLLLALPAALLAASWAGYRLSGRAFAPLRAMTARAEQITATSLHERLQAANSQDELGDMARVFNHLLGRLEEAFQQLRRFSADAAHELRTPLAALRGIGESALQTQPGAGGRSEAIGSMLEEAERLQATIDGLLFLSKAESAPLTASSDRFSLPELSKEILGLLEVLIEERGMQVQQTQMEDGTGLIVADRALIRSALLNVFHNAIKYSPLHSVITVAYARTSVNSKPMQQVCVQDQGPGLAPGEHARVFERFYRGRSQPAIAGAGLGLSVAKLAVEHSGGIIFMDESYSEGTRCCILLPIVSCPDSVTAAGELHAAQPSAASH